MTARVTALTDARSEAEKALQTAQASAAEQKLALEQQRQRGDALLRDLVSAREEVEARKAAVNAADASAKNAQASAIEQKQAAEQERQRGEVLAHQLASAQVDVATLTARVTALTDERSEAEKALQTAQASAAEQKLALEQERQRGDAPIRELAPRELVAESLQNGGAVSRIDAGQAVQLTNSSLQAGSVASSTTRSVLVKGAAPDGPGSASDQQHNAAGSVGKGNSAAASVREPHDAALGDPAASPSRTIRGHQIALWVKRGEEFIAAGDFVSARRVFQRATERGNAKAAFMLAETYDPAALDIRAMGVAPDMAKAHLWYEKAKNLGSPEAVRKLEVRKAAANAADASVTNAHTSSSIRAVSAGGLNEVDTGSGGSPAVLQSPVLLTPQKSEPVRPNPPSAVSAAKSDDGPAQVPEMAPPVSMRPDQGAHQVKRAGRSPRDVSRQNPRMIGRGYRDRAEIAARFPDHAQWLRDRFPDYSPSSRLRHFDNRSLPRRHGQGISRRQNYSSSRLFGG